MHAPGHLTRILNIAPKSRLSLAVAVGAIAFAPGALAATPPTTTAGTTTSKTKTTAGKTTTSKRTTTGRTTTSKQPSAPLGATGKNCYKTLIQDWYDGRIDRTYPVHCYQDALKHLPQDVKTYSDAYDVISRALADATRGQTKIDPNEPVPPPDAAPTGTDTTGTGTTGTTTSATPGTGSDDGPIGTGLGSGDRGATGIPVPLLILGGLALLLVAAGAAGFLVRRYQSRGGPSPS
jgi:hypothetical protein